MNFGKIHIKSALFLIQIILAFNFTYSQEYILEFKNTIESEKKLKKYKTTKSGEKVSISTFSSYEKISQSKNKLKFYKRFKSAKQNLSFYIKRIQNL